MRAAEGYSFVDRTGVDDKVIGGHQPPNIVHRAIDIGGSQSDAGGAAFKLARAANLQFAELVVEDG